MPSALTNSEQLRFRWQDSGGILPATLIPLQSVSAMPGPYSVKFESNVPLMLRDGIMTYVDVCRPDASGGFPGLMLRTPYNKSEIISRAWALDIIRAAQRGYAVVIQDIRGRHSSEGQFYPFINEASDGHDSIDWLASQPWCSGKVGMFGSSYNGATQWLAASTQIPQLGGIAPGVTASDYHEGWTWQGGAFELGFNMSWSVGALTAANWQNLSKQLFLSPYQLDALMMTQDDLKPGAGHLPMNEYEELKGDLAPYYFDWMEHPEYDDYWKAVCIEEMHSDIVVPAFNYGGWYDIFVGGTVRNFMGMREAGGSSQARALQRLVIGPWTHVGLQTSVAGERSFGAASSTLADDVPGGILRFYDYLLHGEENGLTDDKPVRIFVMGDNVWREESEWPLDRAISTDFYLSSDGRANTLAGDGALAQDSPADCPPDVFLYNPLDPVPTHGGNLCCDVATLVAGVFDQRPIETRGDVLVYTSSPMEQDTEVTGPVVVTLYASSSAVDTDFTAKLVDVRPDGYAANLCDGIIRARYRTPRQPASLLEPGDVYEFTIDLGPTSNVFKKGHSIRIEISSSNFPRFDRNLNLGEPVGTSGESMPALQTVHHSSQYPSRITLPVVPRD